MMWRSFAVVVALAGVLAGCSLGGGSGAGSAQVISPRTVATTLSRIGLSVRVSDLTTSRQIRSIKLYRGRGVHVSWVVVAGFGSPTPDGLGASSSPVGLVQVFGAESAAQADVYVAKKPSRVFQNGATLVSSYANAIVVVGGTPASAARVELRRVMKALAATAG